jgi:hypothetical protein
VVRPRRRGPRPGEGTATFLIAIGLCALAIGLLGIVLLARRDEAKIVTEWRQLLSRDEKAVRQSLESQAKAHTSALRFWRSRADSARASGAVIAGADLRHAESEYERDTRDERRALSRARRMLRSRQP